MKLRMRVFPNNLKRTGSIEEIQETLNMGIECLFQPSAGRFGFLGVHGEPVVENHIFYLYNEWTLTEALIWRSAGKAKWAF